MSRYGADELAVMKRIAYDDEIIPTRLKPETLESKVQIFRPQLVAAARDSETVTYSDLTDDFHQLAWQDIGRVLGIMGLTEDAMKRPLLPALVVKARSGRPGPQYFSLAEKATQVTDPIPPEAADTDRREMWETHRNQVWKFDWS